MCNDEEYVEAAIEAGFKQLGFSDHGPYKEYSKKTDRMDYDELDGYLNSIYSLKEKYKDKIDIKVGSEFEYFDNHLDQIKELKDKVEYLILGQHYAYPCAEFDYCHDPSDSDKLKIYRDLVCKGMESGYFLYFAHPDYFCGGIYEFDDTCKEITRDIAETAVKTSTPLEINIKLGKRKPQHYKNGDYVMYPFYDFWKIISEYPVKCIYGFDAHDPASLKDMDNYTKADAILKDLKLDFIDKPLL